MIDGSFVLSSFVCSDERNASMHSSISIVGVDFLLFDGKCCLKKSSSSVDHASSDILLEEDEKLARLGRDFCWSVFDSFNDGTSMSVFE